MRKQRNILNLLILVVSVLALSACAPAPAAPAPTQTVSAIYTSAAGTFTAQEATEIASTPPTPVPSQTALPSPAPTTGAASTGLPVTGGTAAPGGTSGATCNNSLYINDATIPDGTVIAPNNTFTKTWTVKNTGTCAWTTAYKLVFITGEAMGGTSAPLTAAVPAGAQSQISVKLTAPALPGNYTGSWQLEDAQGNRFGEIITVVIVVNSGGGAPVTATP
jgi:hypothetical protein